MFAGAFEDAGSEGIVGKSHAWAPSQLGSVYGEDDHDEEDASASLLHGEERSKENGGTWSNSFSDESSIPVGWDTKAKQVIQQGPPAAATFCERFMSALLCCGEYDSYSSIDKTVVSVKDRHTAKRAFHIHWLSIFGYCVNCGLFLFLLISRQESIMELFWSLVYLCAGPVIEWFLFAKPLLATLGESRASSSGLALKCGSFFVGLFHVYLLLGPRWSGSSGIFMLIELVSQKTLPLLAVVLSSIFTLAQVVVLFGGLLVLRAAARDTDAFEI